MAAVRMSITSLCLSVRGVVDVIYENKIQISTNNFHKHYKHCYETRLRPALLRRVSGLILAAVSPLLSDTSQKVTQRRN